MNKTILEIKKHTIVISLQKNGQRIEMSDATRIKIHRVLSRIKLKPGYSIVFETWSDDAVAFNRGRRPPKFTTVEATQIKNDPSSTREKALRYNTSTKTITKIMLGRYTPRIEK